jgi:hypothetical protein
MFRRRDEEVERLRIVVDVLRDQIENMVSLLGDSHARYDQLAEAHRTLTEAHKTAMSRLEQPAEVVPPSFFGNTPIHVSEEEEDTEYAFAHGLIPPHDTTLYKDILKTVGLEPNVEVAD